MRISSPMVSVIMPVYNSVEYVGEAIESILNQTLRDFELIIVDDGSTDGSPDILEHYRRKDDRIHILRQENSGISASRNRGIECATGKYIALMDSDDVSLPERLARQVALMESRADVGLCGVRCSFFGDKGEYVGVCPPTDSKRLKCKMLFLISVSNTSLMIRRDLMVKHGLCYNTDFPVTEDYELLTRLLPYCEVANIPGVLMRIRMRESSITRQWSDNEHYRFMSQAHRNVLSYLGIEPSEEELQLHVSLCTHVFPPGSLQDVNALERWLLKLIAANGPAKMFDRKALAEELSLRWYSACFRASGMGWRVWQAFNRSELLELAKPPLRLRLVLVLACLLRLRQSLVLTMWRSRALDSFPLGKLFKHTLRRLVVIH